MQIDSNHQRMHTMSFLKIKDPKKRDSIVADYIDTQKRIQQRNLDERVMSLTHEEDLQNMFKPVINAAEKASTSIKKELAPIQNNLSDLNNNLQTVDKIKKEEDDDDGAEDDEIGEKYHQMIKKFGGIKLDPYFRLEEVDQPLGKIYMMGNKRVTLDKSLNIYVDGVTYKGTWGLWKLIMMRKPVKGKPEDMDNYEKLARQTNIATHPRNVGGHNRPYQTYKWRNILSKFLQQGEGIHFLPSNIKLLEQKLDILLGEYNAGNQTSTRNEIVPIADELLRRRAISRKEYRHINEFLKE